MNVSMIMEGVIITVIIVLDLIIVLAMILMSFNKMEKLVCLIMLVSKL